MAISETEFAQLIDALAADPERRGELLALGREDHDVYRGRSAQAVVRMRGWLLVALGRSPAGETAELYALEEIATGVEPYLVAAAARLLRRVPAPRASLAPLVLQAIGNIRYGDAPVRFDRYGDYASGDDASTAVGELLATLAWIGPLAQDVASGVEALRPDCGGLSERYRADVDRALEAIGNGEARPAAEARCCCGSAAPERIAAADATAADSPIEAVTFQDHAGEMVGFADYFRGTPSIVCFFYTRCDNPLKCSLTITKLGRVQEMLRQRGADRRVRTAAITYDPLFDTPERMRRYAESRGARLSPDHRMLRSHAGMDAVRRFFDLGVNYNESIVNRHRLEVSVLDARGAVASRYLRVHWDEADVVDRAMQLLEPAPTARR